MKTNQEESPHQTLGLLLGPGLPAFTTMRQEFLLSSPPDYVLLWQQPELGQKVTWWIHGWCSTLLGVVDTEMKGPGGHGHWTSNNPSHFLSGMSLLLQCGAISWSEQRFAAYIQTAVRSAGSHPSFHMTCLQVKHSKCPEVQADPFTSRLGNIPALSHSFLTTNRAGTWGLFSKASRGWDEWTISSTTITGKDCESNCNPVP